MTIYIEQFCGRYDYRDLFHKPFNFQGLTIATNAHILIAMPRDDRYPDADKNEIAAKVNNMLHVGELEYQPIQFPEPIKFKQCPHCKGGGYLIIEQCPECSGDGEVTVGNKFHDYECECKTCGGVGDISRPGGDEFCPNCCGTGEYYPASLSQHLPQFDLHFSPLYLGLLRRLPDITGAVYVTDKGIARLYWRNHQYRGILMPMKV